jgi:hypothetical protein
MFAVVVVVFAKQCTMHRRRTDAALSLRLTHLQVFLPLQSCIRVLKT